MPYVLGLDISTQSASALLLDTQILSVVGELSVPFGELRDYDSPKGFLENLPDGQVHADPRMWLAGLDTLFSRMVEADWPLREVIGISGSGQQHGSVYLKEGFEESLQALQGERSLVEQLGDIFSRPTAPIWMDVSTARECDEITQAVGSAEKVCSLSGSVATERFTGPQIRAFWKRDPKAYESTARIHLVSSFLCSILSGRDAVIDTGDGAGMNLLNLATGDWELALVDASAPDLLRRLPSVRPSTHIAGRVSRFFVERFGINPEAEVLSFTGDNPSSLVGMGAAAGARVVVSLGTSDVLFTSMKEPRTDPEKCGHVFGNPLGGYMTLSVVRNGSLAREAFRDQLGVDWDCFVKAGEVDLPQDAVCLPFVTDEITPKRMAGLLETRSDLPPVERVRAFLEGQAFNLLRQLDWMNQQPSELCLTGGASKNHGIAQVFADVFNVPVSRLSVPNSAALGAAMRAALACDKTIDPDVLAGILTASDSTVFPRSFTSKSSAPVNESPPGESSYQARFRTWIQLLKPASKTISSLKPSLSC